MKLQSYAANVRVRMGDSGTVHVRTQVKAGIPTLELIKTAIEAGEMDTQLQVSTGNLCSSFHS